MRTANADQGPVVLITGASSGIGLATATLLAAEGYRVFGTSRSAQASASGAVRALVLDVTEQASVDACVREVVRAAGRIDVLVNNAGTGIAGAAEETSVDEAQDVHDTNLWGAVRMIRAVLPVMRQQGSGRIVNMSSAGGFIGIPFRGAYCASKFALEGYCEALRYEVRPFGIHVSLVEPTGVKTPAGDHVPNAADLLDAYATRREPFTANFNRSMQDGMPADRVARTIAGIIKKKQPRLRYRVGAQAKALNLLRRTLPSAAFEQFVRSIFKV